MAHVPQIKRWRWIAISLLLLPALAVALLATSGEGHETLGPVRGLRLGAAPSQARARLRTESPGSFSTLAMGEDFAVVWTPIGAAGDLRAARMEFHLGQLVALRLSLAPGAPESAGPALELTEASVLAREPAPDGVSLTWLARTCPTHADEVQRRLAGHR